MFAQARDIFTPFSSFVLLYYARNKVVIFEPFIRCALLNKCMRVGWNSNEVLLH